MAYGFTAHGLRVRRYTLSVGYVLVASILLGAIAQDPEAGRVANLVENKEMTKRE